MAASSTLVVVAKECLPGRVKTRLSPALSAVGAADVAAAMLEMTLDAGARSIADRRVLFFDGAAPAGAAGWEVLQQPQGALDARLGALFDQVEGRTLLIGMDTPQVAVPVLDSVLTDRSGADAWFGAAVDGGFWALGVEQPSGDLVRGVPMSRADTGTRQLRRLQLAGLRVRLLPELVDVDTIAEAETLGAAMPGTPFASALRRAREVAA